MTASRIRGVQEVLDHASQFPWNHALYLPSGEVRADTPCMVLDPNDYVTDDEIPNAARAAGLRYALTISQLQDIVENARARHPNASGETLVTALRYYLEHDAFEE